MNNCKPIMYDTMHEEYHLFIMQHIENVKCMFITHCSNSILKNPPTVQTPIYPYFPHYAPVDKNLDDSQRSYPCLKG
jgi:hypothetical protein